MPNSVSCVPRLVHTIHVGAHKLTLSWCFFFPAIQFYSFIYLFNFKFPYSIVPPVVAASVKFSSNYVYFRP